MKRIAWLISVAASITGACTSDTNSGPGPSATSPNGKADGFVECSSDSDCALDEMCDGPQGCGIPWTCVPQRACTRDIAAYCGCDGVTFYSSGSCPGQPYEYEGECGTPPPGCSSDADCGEGEMCDGPQGCDMAWTCVPQRACTRDLAPHCGCDGNTFFSSSSCPGQPYSRPGRCEDPPSGCTSDADCGEDEMCDGPQGCDMPWTCVPQRACTRDIVAYCGCDGATFFSSGSCPGQPYEYEGECTGATTCSSDADCGDGEMCDGEAGCGMPWTCVPQRACTRDIRPYCGCDGVTFYASGSCPGQPHEYAGECER